ncbi:hypothetical protein [Arthrobacter sp. 35W]|uniref:hypothetical protein n=1 Tax=Arthrobacter sp. 35W TaxID=1132441 RepID=UPI0003F53190|nr:hypothetical protein [Arthrobacter sp. 35W]
MADTEDNSRPQKPGDHGRYVSGSYGQAGSVPGHLAEEPEGRYVEGDYGEAGEEDALTGAEAGRYEEGDYGDAGSEGGQSPTHAPGRYTEEDRGGKE